MNRYKLIVSALMSGLFVQPVHCMLTRVRTIATLPKNKLKLQQQYISTQTQTPRTHVPQVQSEHTTEPTQQNIFADYPHLNSLEPGLLRTQCEIIAENIQLQAQHIPMIEKGIQNGLSLEHELIKCRLAGENTTEIEQQIVLYELHFGNLKKLWNNFKQINEDKKALTVLNNGLKNASHHGTRVFTTFPKLLTHMIKKPSNISLANCFAHYPGSIGFSTTLAADLVFLSKLEFFAGIFHEVDLFVAGVCCSIVVPAFVAAFISGKMTHKRAIKHLLNSTYSRMREDSSELFKNASHKGEIMYMLTNISSDIQEDELQKYAKTVENLALQNQSFSSSMITAKE